jgi:hypothetical protein
MGCDDRFREYMFRNNRFLSNTSRDYLPGDVVISYEKDNKELVPINKWFTDENGDRRCSHAYEDDLPNLNSYKAFGTNVEFTCYGEL